MDILLYKDGHLAVSEGPLEGKENNLKDVVMLITNPQEGDSLTYKGGKWVNGAGGSGGGGLVVHVLLDESAQTASLDKTWQEIYDAVMAGANVSFVHEDPAEQYTLDGISGIGRDNLEYYVTLNTGTTYSTDTPSGYPNDSNK